MRGKVVGHDTPPWELNLCPHPNRVLAISKHQNGFFPLHGFKQKSTPTLESIELTAFSLAKPRVEWM
ncbi:hypothetical protein PSE10A_55590 [Pseudomonas amygdali pv. eriobotryae]|uniref:Uncharacterized protein n=1 Tax=Pseudomonas amygdali pv. eriobotryae TaxID=129137 RepID=A0A9P3AK65_PSEA0|nr:hypothetical protein PSE10A_55590 [Pseudomonas amygdali pv. eriobotryae]